MTRFYLFIPLFFICGYSMAQPDIKVEQPRYFFGSIHEEEGSVKHRFVFTNIGDKPLVLERVQTSCGCTTPEWTKKPVQPGDSGFVDVVFNPAKRVGDFSKSLIIYSNAVQDKFNLNITGRVIPKPREPSEVFPKKDGPVRISSQYINFGKIDPEGVAIMRKFSIYNDSTEPLDIRPDGLPKFLAVTLDRNPLPPEGIANVRIVFNPKMIQELGYYTLPFTLMAGNHPVKFTLVASFTPLPDTNISEKEYKKAPRFSLVTPRHSFADIKQGEIVTKYFKFKNSGKSDLKIIKTESSCGCTVAQIESEIIEPGHGGQIAVIFNTKNKLGKQHQTITLFTNDPIKPVHQLSLIGTVVK